MAWVVGLCLGGVGILGFFIWVTSFLQKFVRTNVPFFFARGPQAAQLPFLLHLEQARGEGAAERLVLLAILAANDAAGSRDEASEP